MRKYFSVNHKLSVRLILGLVILLLAAYMFSLPLEQVLFAVDFTEYWSASRLLLKGENPYSIEAMWRIQSALPDWPYDHPVKLYNPPWVLSLILPLGFLPYGAARLVWLIFSTGVILLCLDMCWRLFQGPRKRRWVGWVMGFSFLPTLGCLDLGQISFLVLLGITAFMTLMEKKKWFLAGCAAFLVAVKPQLLVLVWLVLFLWVIKSRRWMVLAGAATAGLGMIIPTLLINPMIFSQYLAFTQSNPPYYFEVPTIAFALRLLLDYERIWLQYIPTIIGVGWLVWYWRKHKQSWDWREHLPLVIMVSFVITSFAWTFDQIVLLPLLVQATAWVGRNFRNHWWIAGLYFLVHTAGLAQYLIIGTIPFWYLWQAPVLLLVYAIFYKAMEVERTASETDRSTPSQGIV